MAWMTLIGVMVAFECATIIRGSVQTYDIEPSLQKNIITDNANTASQDFYKPPVVFNEDFKLQSLGHHLMEILLHPDQGVPIIYVEEYPNGGLVTDESEINEGNEYFNQYPDLQQRQDSSPEMSEIPFKRSRYYRKYPWKRQNSREAYDAENRYLCQPSREDVFRLLVALHEARQGNSRTVNFCNRRRPAKAVFTNIRFLGRRK